MEGRTKHDAAIEKAEKFTAELRGRLCNVFMWFAALEDAVYDHGGGGAEGPAKQLLRVLQEAVQMTEKVRDAAAEVADAILRRK